MIKISDHLKASLRQYLSIRYLSTAKTLIKEVELIEKKKEKHNHDENARHQGYVVSSIILIVAFLESTINEIFSDCEENVNNDLKNIYQSRSEMLGEMWKLGIPRTAKYSILGKYQIALTLLKKQQFSKDKNPYQDVRLLIKLRNALIHYEPESVTVYDSLESWIKQPEKFERVFKNKFKLNSLSNPNQIFFPDKILGYGCAEWAIEAALNFVNEFHKRIEITPKYKRVLDI